MDELIKKNLEEILNKNKTVTTVANEFNVSRPTVYKWLNNYKNLEFHMRLNSVEQRIERIHDILIDEIRKSKDV